MVVGHSLWEVYSFVSNALYHFSADDTISIFFYYENVFLRRREAWTKKNNIEIFLKLFCICFGEGF